MNHSGLVDLVHITNPEDIGSGLPPSTSEDAGKVLKVDSEGVPGWGEDAMATVDQNYGSTSTHAQSGTAVAQAISTKQDTISDLDTIRSGAAAGATAVQPSQLATVATTGSYADLINKPSIPAAQVNSDWNAASGVSQILNKPSLATVATTGAYSDLSGTPTIPTVDQTYNASSTNAQSGTAVAQAISSASYTAGVGIDITAGVVSADIDDVTIKQQSTETSTSMYGGSSGSYAVNGGYIAGPGDTAASKLNSLITEGGSATIHVPGNTFYFSTQPSSDVVLSFTTYFRDTTSQSILSGYVTALSTTYDSATSRYWVDEQDVVLEGPASGASASNWINPQAVLSRSVAGVGISTKDGSYVSTQWAFASDYGTTGHVLQYVETVPTNKIAVSNPLPASTSADSTKVLTVNAQGSAEWAASALGSVNSIQQVNALPANPDANTLYLIPEA